RHLALRTTVGRHRRRTSSRPHAALCRADSPANPALHGYWTVLLGRRHDHLRWCAATDAGPVCFRSDCHPAPRYSPENCPMNRRTLVLIICVVILAVFAAAAFLYPRVIPPQPSQQAQAPAQVPAE